MTTTTSTLTLEQLDTVLTEAAIAARQAADDYFQDKLGGVDQFSCGFAWVNIYKYKGQAIKGNTKLGKMLKQLGVRQDYTRAFQVWNPASYPCQNVDTLEAGARAYAQVLTDAGFTAYAGSRLD